MRIHSGSTTSVWMTEEPQNTFGPNRNQQVDVCFIGAGIAGITTAYFLVRAGKMVAVLDNGQSVAVKRVVRVGDAAPQTLRLNPAADAGLVAERAYCEVYEEAKVTTQLRHNRS